ncbi:Rieske (2Fe-2S) protein [Kocuria massiliensis]|uniref:Rieske (2Fe-2S) protein n=1 Tax=Kocuria massiliensis TaxID=1926282 RepID=UPI0022B981D2|nr:Rieske (2Fe-2S) protein [Kocuria massiliensis]
MTDHFPTTARGVTGTSPHDAAATPETAAPETPRRTALAGAGIIAGSAVVLSACGSDSGGESDGKASIDPSHPVDLTSASEVPVGGGIKASADGVTAIVSQPKEGEFKAFSSSCTHQGCSVDVKKDVIMCPCHSSQFSLTDGSVQGGPAPKPLPEYTVSVTGGRVTIS